MRWRWRRFQYDPDNPDISIEPDDPSIHFTDIAGRNVGTGSYGVAGLARDGFIYYRLGIRTRERTGYGQWDGRLLVRLQRAGGNRSL